MEMSKAEARALLRQPRVKLAYRDGFPIVIPMPVAVVKADPAQERATRFAQRTLYDVRPKPGKDGGTPKGVGERKQIEYKSVHVFKVGKTASAHQRDKLIPAIERDDLLDRVMAGLEVL